MTPAPSLRTAGYSIVATTLVLLLLLLLLPVPGWAASPATAGSPLRIGKLYRCGDLMSEPVYSYCMELRGGSVRSFQLELDGESIGTAESVGSAESPGLLRFALDRREHRSGPLRVRQGGRSSNPVWLSMQASATVAAGADDVARNDDGITTFRTLVSIVLEEEHDGPVEAERIAAKYGATVVGRVPPLRIYQLRLQAPDLIHRDAQVLRLGGEHGIDAVAIEESSAEEGERSPGAPAAIDRELAANRYVDAIDYYRHHVGAQRSLGITPAPIRIGIVEREIDFDSPNFLPYLDPAPGSVRLFARDGDRIGHGSMIAGVLAAAHGNGGAEGFLSGISGHHGGIDIIVDRGSDAGVVENVAASVRMVQDGVRVLNWSWGIHRVGARTIAGGDVDSAVRTGVAFDGYEELLEQFFKWLRREHPDVVVVNSAGNAASISSDDDYRLPSSFVTEQLIVVGGHQRSEGDLAVEEPGFARHRGASNIDGRVDITAAACIAAPLPASGKHDDARRCGTSYSTAVVTGLIAAMLTINPALSPDQVRMLLRRSAMPIGNDLDFEAAEAEDLTAPILPSERAAELDHPDIGRSARLDMRKALKLAADSLTTKE
jgi:subtilisin family serine protease